MLEEETAAELAAAFDLVQTMDLTYTGPLSVLDEATLRWTQKYPQLVPTHREYAEAWQRLRRRDTPADRRAVRMAAARLAGQLRQLGDTRLVLCTEPAGWGRCKGVLDDEGRCPSPHVHLAQRGNSAG